MLKYVGVVLGGKERRKVKEEGGGEKKILATDPVRLGVTHVHRASLEGPPIYHEEAR